MTQIEETLQNWRQGEVQPFKLGKIEGIAPAKFRHLLEATADETMMNQFLVSLSSQLEKENVGRRSELIVESGQKCVLRGIEDLLANEREPIDLVGDLDGQSSLREVSNTSRWHPAEYQPAAYAAADPKENKFRDRVSLNILALFGLRFFPPIDTQKGRRTPGLRRVKGGKEFSWPIWTTPLNADEIQSLVLHPACHEQVPPKASLTAMGLRQVWRSTRFTRDQNDYFSTAKPAW